MISAVERYLDEQVQRGALVPGSRVPTERALAELLGRSRHDVRRQLDVLESQGRVTREVGRGTFLTGSPARTAEPVDGLVRSPTNLSPLDLIPDVIPFAGWLDDVVIIPMLVTWIVSMLPQPAPVRPSGRAGDDVIETTYRRK